MVYHDEDVEVYINGVLAATEEGFVNAYLPMEIQSSAKALLKPGAKIVIAVHCHQTKGGQGIDVGLANVVEQIAQCARVSRAIRRRPFRSTSSAPLRSTVRRLFRPAAAVARSGAGSGQFDRRARRLQRRVRAADGDRAVDRARRRRCGIVGRGRAAVERRFARGRELRVARRRHDRVATGNSRQVVELCPRGDRWLRRLAYRDSRVRRGHRVVRSHWRRFVEQRGVGSRHGHADRNDERRSLGTGRQGAALPTGGTRFRRGSLRHHGSVHRGRRTTRSSDAARLPLVEIRSDSAHRSLAYRANRQ